jgi:hypothetical protein
MGASHLWSNSNIEKNSSNKTKIHRSINPATIVNAFALTLFFYAVGFKPSSRRGAGLPIRLPFSQSGRRGIAQRAFKGDEGEFVIHCL